MRLLFLNFILPIVLAGNSPADWTCAPLTKITSSVDGCVASSSYSDGVWSIATSTAKTGTGANKFCVISLSGEGVHTSSDFYVKAHFSNGQPGKPGPFGGITFNMEDNNNGNYVMMRLKVPVAANVQMGKIVNAHGHNLAQSAAKNNAVASGAALLEILVRDEQETVWVDGVLEETISSQQPFFVAPGHIGFGFQSVTAWPSIKVTGAEVCTPVTCTAEDGKVYSGGDQWVDDDGKTCTCSAEGINCVCGDDDLVCPGGTTKWTEPNTCLSKCIRPPAHCHSTGDPHYKTFDGKYYDFHGMCTYQAASCEDFVVNFKNIDFHNRAPRYTRRIEIEFNGQVFAIQAGNGAFVDGTAVQVPYIKTYTNGDRLEIIYNGQLEMLLYNKGRSPSVRTRATNYGTWINAEMWLHGSCADVTEGLCGRWNGNQGDDLINNDPNTNGEHYKKYDENCPAPPKPYHPCDDIPGGKVEAEKLCGALKASPFTSCHSAVSIGNADGGPLGDCVTDVCHCWLDQSCACPQFDTYADSCIANGVDLSNWRESVEFCPYECPEPTVYKADGATPVPTCLDKDPEQTGTVRGCFCPENQFLQDGECVAADGCKCLYEGQFYDNGATIEKKAECKTCTCQDAGEMVCEDFECPALNCDDNEIEATKPDECCPYCDDSWVEALNPDVTVKKGQKIVLTCAVHAEVPKSAIVWYKGNHKVKKGISRNRLRLTIDSADATHDGDYRCEATKDGKVNSDMFVVDVVMPAVCQHEDGTEFEEGTIYNPQETEECTCDSTGVHTCECIDDGEKCTGATPVVWFNDNCVKTCVPEQGLCSAAADPHYKTFDGSEFSFKGDCKYNFFGCGEVKMYADHEKDKASTKTKYLEIAFKNDVYKLEENKITLNGEDVTAPLHKTYKDGSTLQVQDVGQFILSIVQDGKDPLVELTWDKVTSYNLKVHGTCKGQSTGMCGKWNDNKKDDMTMPDGKVADSVEAFGTAWAVDDEDECPEPPPIPDICEDYGLMDQKEEFEAHVRNVLKVGVLAQCAKVLNPTETMEAAVQEICQCFGDLNCACPVFNAYATACEAEDFNTAGWALKNKNTECAPSCPEGSTFMDRGPKPAPSCAKPKGGRKTQKGCFCPEGQVMEGGECIDAGDCKCEYAGQRYDVGDKYDKPDICQSCKCVGNGEEECDDIKCNTECADDEIEISVDGECCTQCLANWVEAVNPNPEGTINEALSLTCKVTGVEVTADDIKWVQFAPEVDVSKPKRIFEISDDGLVLTIKSMNEKRVGNYKCVVTKDDKTSEGVFEVTLPIVHEDLIEPVQDSVQFIEGKDLVLEVRKLGGVITDLYWECNGVRMEKKIVNKKTNNKLIIKGATADMAGSCTCFVKGIGSQDSAEITVEAQANEVTIKPVKKKLTCVEGKKKCNPRCTVTKTAGAVSAKAVKLCKLLDNGKLHGCKSVKKKKGKFGKSLGKVTAKTAGNYVCVHTEDGVETVGPPTHVTTKTK